MTDLFWLLSEFFWFIVGLTVGVVPAVLLWRKLHEVKKFTGYTGKTMPTGTTPTSHSTGGGVLVPLRDEIYANDAIQVGLELARKSGQALQVVIFLEIPHTRSLDCIMNEETEVCCNLLERAEQAAQAADIKLVTDIVRVRNYALGIAETAKELNSGIVILQQTKRVVSLTAPSLASLAEVIQAKTDCNVILLNPHHAQKALAAKSMAQH